MFTSTFAQKGITTAVALALALGLFMGGMAPVRAQTTTDLQAQIQSLLAMITSLQAQLAALSGGTTGGTCYVFNRNLTQGSTGEDVRQLQIRLNRDPSLQVAFAGAGSPGNETAFFGPLTRNAVIKYQEKYASMVLHPLGLTRGTGNVGPSTRAHLNANCTIVTPPGTGTTTPPADGISTPGVEGIISVALAPTPASGTTVRETQNDVGIMGLNIEAIRSDLRVERIRVNLGNSSTLYRRVFDELHVKAPNGNVLASLDMDAATVVREGSTYFATFTGIDYIVRAGTTEKLTISADIRNSIDTADQGSHTLTIPADGVRAIDGAGINQYGPTNAISRNFTVSASLAESADLRISLNTSSPRAQEVIASEGSDNDEFDELTLLVFDLRADRDDILITDFTAQVAKTGSGSATATTAYLYDGSTLIGSASINSTTGIAVFSNIDFTVNRGSTETITLRADIRDANNTAAVFQASATSTSAVAENSEGSTVSPSGSATGENITVRSAGPEFALLSKSITKSQTPVQNNTSTSTVEATFTVRVRAVGSDVMFGSVASSNPMFGTTTDHFQVYRNGVELTGGDLLVASSTAYNIPSSGVVTSGLTNSFTLQEGNTVDIPVTFRFEGRTVGGSLVEGGSYAVGLEGITWVGSGGVVTTDFMEGLTEWRTTTVSMP